MERQRYADWVAKPLPDYVTAPPPPCAQRAPGGVAILSWLLNEQAAEVIAVYDAAGFNLVRQDAIVDWTTLVLVRRGAE